MRYLLASLILIILSIIGYLYFQGNGKLAGSSWRLINIAVMDGSNYQPDDRSKYTLTLDRKNNASINADCNQIVAAWETDSHSKIEFNLSVEDLEHCSKNSISTRFIEQFQWIRSYIFQNGHLYLATLADGAILEFEPLPPIVAKVLGENIRANDADEMQSIILSKLFNHYAIKHGIKVEKNEITVCLKNLHQNIPIEISEERRALTADEKQQVDEMEEQFIAALIEQWKINQSLYETYGGRIIYQQLGPEPLDAYKSYIQEREHAGDILIYNTSWKNKFWQYFNEESRHDFMPEGSKDEKEAFTTLPCSRKSEPSSL